jgi:malate dehydrogenase
MNSRTDLLEFNRHIIKEISSSLRGLTADAILVTLSNPIDIMNFLVWKYTRVEREKVIGSAGMLDSSRLRSILSMKYGTPPSRICAYVIGEHGSNQVPVLSRVEVDGKKLVFSREQYDNMRKQLRKSASEVISKKGATVFAPANNTVNLIGYILKDKNETVICSSILKGEYGLNNISIGVPAIIGRSGISEIIEWDLDKEERMIFLKGARNLKSLLHSISDNPTEVHVK